MNTGQPLEVSSGDFTGRHETELLSRETLLIFILNHDGKKDCYSHKTTSLIPKITEAKAETKQKTHTSGNPLEKTVCNQSKHFMGTAAWHQHSLGSLITKLPFEMTGEINQIINSKISMPEEN